LSRAGSWQRRTRFCGNAIIWGCWLFQSARRSDRARRPKVLDFTTKNPAAEFAQVREIAETEGTRVASSLNNRVIYLADIGMIAPMLGLLGTVFGIIRSFGALGGDLEPNGTRSCRAASARR